MRMQHLLMIGAAVVLIVLTGTAIVGGPLGTLLLVGLLLLCPLMMVGVHRESRSHVDRATHGSQEHGSREEVGRDGQ